MGTENLFEMVLGLMSHNEMKTVLREAIEAITNSIKCETCHAEDCQHNKKECKAVVLGALMVKAHIISQSPTKENEKGNIKYDA